MKRNILLFLPLCVFGFFVLFFWKGLSLDPHNIPSVQLGKHLPNFNLPMLDNPNVMLTPDNLQNRVVLLNVWASWCEACREEQVVLLQLSHMGVPIYGLNYKDNRENALNWLRQWGNPFIAIGSDTLGKVAIDLGVYGAPETFVIDQFGIIRYRHVGVLTMDVWEKIISPLVKKLEHNK